MKKVKCIWTDLAARTSITELAKEVVANDYANFRRHRQ